MDLRESRLEISAIQWLWKLDYNKKKEKLLYARRKRQRFLLDHARIITVQTISKLFGCFISWMPGWVWHQSVLTHYLPLCEWTCVSARMCACVCVCVKHPHRTSRLGVSRCVCVFYECVLFQGRRNWVASPLPWEPQLEGEKKMFLKKGRGKESGFHGNGLHNSERCCSGPGMLNIMCGYI